MFMVHIFKGAFSLSDFNVMDEIGSGSFGVVLVAEEKESRSK